MHMLGLRRSQDRVSFEYAWLHCVDGLEEFWAKFYAIGKKHFSNFEPWIGPMNKQRRKYSLLRYLIEAGHQNQHGLINLNWVGGHIRIGQGFNGQISDLVIYKDVSYVADVRPSSFNKGGMDVVKHHGGEPKLPGIFNRKTKKSFAPPSSKHGVTHTPQSIIKSGYEHYDDLIKQAQTKFIKS